jgi:hypothetical protein
MPAVGAAPIVGCEPPSHFWTSCSHRNGQTSCYRIPDAVRFRFEPVHSTVAASCYRR